MSTSQKNRNIVTRFLIFLTAVTALFCSGSSAWATVGQDDTETGYTNKDIHSNDPNAYYKHPGRGSFTGPFDYGIGANPQVESQGPAGKCNCFTFDGTRSFSGNGQRLTYAWDLGDGTTSDQAVVKHCYEKAGDYTSSLTVTDESGKVCGNGTAVTKITSNFPPTARAGKDQEACLGDTVSFDASGSTASSGTAKYTWDFGDGEKADGEKITHTYQKSGKYRVRLHLDDGKNTECSLAQDVINTNITERAQVKLTGAASVCVGSSVRFQAGGSGVSKYSWDFGDGSTWEGGSNASHTYEKGGTYTVRVTGESGRGGSCAAASDNTVVKVSSRPIAKAGENLACCIDREASFDGSGSISPDGKTLSYHWDFGDGDSADGAKASHAYKKGGNYRVVLTVKDDSGSECSVSSDSFVADVNTKPEAVIQVR